MISKNIIRDIFGTKKNAFPKANASGAHSGKSGFSAHRRAVICLQPNSKPLSRIYKVTIKLHFGLDFIWCSHCLLMFYEISDNCYNIDRKDPLYIHWVLSAEDFKTLR